ncbi:LysR family transcriptional regulator [Pseudonocardia sp. DSM 110487]|uniref:LysR family transcriptional regulator n=1 Tax=Pseudonocardia sp. DSM 110487 TaxID=2865833 RepID=UPI001C69A1D7|nr:LysR family transcriptional regulator [Pseudonocardia sp. DSM 110487]QYN37198.1 LysR family transcriptional regulator [Pseudonocardia sp. DSM 110487]
MLDVDRLVTLRAVIVAGSFSAAARELHLTQPAVSRQVALLERQVGVELVRRTRRGVHPTEAGRVLAGHTDAVVGRLELAEAEVAELAGVRRGTLRLGSFFTALVHLSTELGAVFGEQHPEVVITDDLVDRREALAKVAAGSLDLAIVFEHDAEPGPAGGEEIAIVPLFDDPLRVLLPAGHPCADRSAVDLRDLVADTWVRAHDGSAARLVDRVLGAADIAPPVLLAGHGDEPIEAQALVAAGRAVTVAHALNVISVPARIAVRPVSGLRAARHVQAAVLRDQRSPLVLAALEALRKIRPLVEP